VRVPLRSKLALAAAIPLALVALAVGAMVYRSLTLRSTEDFEARSLRLNDSIAAQLDGQLARAAQVARCTAAFVAVNPELTQQQIERTLAAALRQEPLIFGAAVAFEPGAFDPKRRLVAPYVVRNRSAAAGTPQGDRPDLRVLDIGAESYDYTDPKWEWYRLPRESGVAAWTEPYFDRGAGDALLCTYGVPIVRDGRTIGVATVDVPIAELQDRLRPELREGERFFVLSGRGAFVSAPDATLVSVRTLQSVADERDDAALRRLSQMMLAGRRGIVQGDGLTRNGGEVDPTWYFFAPVPTSGWSLAVTVPVRAMSTIEQGNFRDSMPTLALGLVAVTGCVWAAARRFTRPIDDLSRAVKAMSSGRFDEVVVPEFRSNDELGELADSVEQTLGELRGRVPLLVREQVDHELKTRVDSEVEREVTRRLASAATRSGRRVATSIDPWPGRKTSRRLARRPRRTTTRLTRA
jgi:HAMP domain-containing protein